MNRITATLFLLSSALLLPLQAYGQKSETTRHRQYEDNRMFSEAAKEKSLLTRGVVAPEYQFLHNGTWYVETKEFKKGEVLYNNRLYSDVELNIDACRNLLVVKTGIVTATDADYVEYAVIDGSKYVNLRYQNRIEGAPVGFCKVEFEGPVSFYSLVQKTISNSQGYHNGEDIGYYDPEYRDNVVVGTRNISVDTYFSYSKKYYIVIDGRCSQVKTKGSLLKKFDKPTAKLLKKYAAGKKLNSVDVPFEQYARTILTYHRDYLSANNQEGVR